MGVAAETKGVNGGVAVWDGRKSEAELRQRAGDEGEYEGKNRAAESGAL